MLKQGSENVKKIMHEGFVRTLFSLGQNISGAGFQYIVIPQMCSYRSNSGSWGHFLTMC